MAEAGELQLLWGDIHNHNELGYGQGSLDRSYEIARSHLDFYAFTTHAQYADGGAPDGYPIVNANWGGIQQAAVSYYDPGRFTTFLAYEWHSSQWVHVHVVYEEDDRPLHFAPTLADLQTIHRDERSILVPHHIAYNRGVDWDLFDPEFSPVVEIFSEHGNSERDVGLHPLLGHSGGPGSVPFTAQSGLARGHRFAFSAGTDNHDGYPGGYGLGLTGVWAEENTRRSVMDAIRAGKTYAVTGDRVELWMTANGEPMGSSLGPGDLDLSFDVTGRDVLSLVELIKDSRTIMSWGPDAISGSDDDEGLYRLRVEYGWGPMKGYHVYDWTGHVEVIGGQLVNAVQCFASDPFDEHRRKEVGSVSESSCDWHSHTSRGGVFTTRNSNTVARANDAVCFEVQGSPHTRVVLEMTCHAGQSIVATNVDWSTANHRGKAGGSFTIGELLEGRAAVRMGKPSPWIVMHRAFPTADLNLNTSVQLTNVSGSYLYLRATQANGQMAWSSPIFVDA